MKYINIRLMLPMLLCIASLNTSAHNFEVDGIYYNITSAGDMTVAVTYGGGYADLGTSYSGNVAIPPSVSYDGKTYRVTSIGNEAFSKCSQLMSVSIPESVTSIGFSAFYGCSSLVTANIPKAVTIVSNYAFSQCSSLKSIAIPESVTSINDGAFYGCTGLSSMEIPDNTVSIGEYAFGNCSGLTSVTMGKNVTSIGDYAFASCDAMTSVHITDLEAWCKITFASNISNPLYKAHHLFLNGEEITNLQIPDGITSINDYVFYGGSGFTSVDIPNCVTTIKWCAFSDCCNLSSLIIPKSVTTIDDRAFSGCGIESVMLENCPIMTFSSNFNAKEVIFDCEKVTDILRGVKTVEAITLGLKVTAIDNNAFSGCTGLASVKFQCASTSIGTSLFNGCTALKSAVFDCEMVPALINGLSTIEQVTLTERVTTIGSDAFKGCTGIYSMIFPSSVTSINNTAFSSTSLKKTIWLSALPPTGYANAKGEINYVMNDKYSSLSNTKVYPFLGSLFDKNGVWYVPTSATDLTCDAIDCAYDDTVKNAVIPNTVSYKGVSMTVRNIMPYLAFCNLHIDSLSIDTYGAISENAFYGCANLKRVAIGDSISKIGKEVFWKCQNLETVTMGKDVIDSIGGCFVGNNIMEIGARAFAGCNIKKLKVGNREDVLTLMTYSFDSCPIEELYLGGDITWPSHLSSPFYQNTSLRTVTINEKETEIANLEFYGCTNLQSVSIGNGVRTIGNKAFSGCSTLKNFVFGKSVQSIGQEAFNNCASLVEITSKATVPPTCGNQALEGINKWECKLVVPEGCKAEYQSAEQWKDFFFVDEKAFKDDSTDEPAVQKCAAPTIAYADGRLMLSTETDDAECVWTLRSMAESRGRGITIEIPCQYELTVYATKEGWQDSDRTTATLIWGDADVEGDNVIRLGGGRGADCDVNGDGTVDVADIATIISEMAARARKQSELEE